MGNPEKQEKDILKLIPAPKQPPRLTARRIGIHTSTAGGVENAAERAYRLGCNTFQIFSSSPRQWKPYELARAQCDEMGRLRERYGLNPLVIHANYLVNLAGGNSEFHAKSMAAFRGEVERALALCAEFLVLHPGSFRGSSREEGLQRAALGIEQAVDGLDLAAATSHPHRKYRRLGVLSRRQLRAGCRTALFAEQGCAVRGVHRHLSHACFRLRHRGRSKASPTPWTSLTAPSG